MSNLERLYVKAELTKDLCQIRYGSFQKFADAWRERYQKQAGFPVARGRTTLWNWLADGIPIKKRTYDKHGGHPTDLSVVGFAALLDADPFCLFDFERNGFFSDFGRFRQFTYEDSFVSEGSWPIWRILQPQDTWPSNSFSRSFFGRTWSTSQLPVNPSGETQPVSFITVDLFGRGPVEPRAYHVACKRTNRLNADWRTFGSIIVDDTGIELFEDRGRHQRKPGQPAQSILLAIDNKGRPMEWMIASLHAFEVNIANGSGHRPDLMLSW